MHLNPAGEMVRAVWDDIPHFYPEVDVDAFAVMPNHIHGIILLGVGAGPRACPAAVRALNILRATAGGCPYNF